MTPQNDVREIIKQAIKLVGTLTEFAMATGVTYQTVLDWKHGRRNPSAVNALRIERATNGKVSAKNIRPDYPWEEMEKAMEQRAS